MRQTTKFILLLICICSASIIDAQQYKIVLGDRRYMENTAFEPPIVWRLKAKLPNGDWYVYSDSAKTILWSRDHYKDSVRNGEHFGHLYSRGNLTRGRFVNGVMQGLWITYEKDTNCKTYSNYLNGQISDREVGYCDEDTNKKIADRIYKNRKVVWATSYSKPGVKEQIGYYDTTRGNLTREIDYDSNGRLKSEWRFTKRWNYEDDYLNDSFLDTLSSSAYTSTGYRYYHLIIINIKHKNKTNKVEFEFKKDIEFSAIKNVFTFSFDGDCLVSYTVAFRSDTSGSHFAYLDKEGSASFINHLKGADRVELKTEDITGGWDIDEIVFHVDGFKWYH